MAGTATICGSDAARANPSRPLHNRHFNRCINLLHPSGAVIAALIFRARH
jgi:hypothetical protein